MVSLVVALFFVPAIIDRWQYSSQRQHLRLGRVVVRCNRFYSRYIAFTSRRKWVYYVLLVLAFGIPFQFLPDRLGTDDEAYGMEQADEARLPWYDALYNQTLGNSTFVDKYKPLLSKYLGGTVQMFADYWTRIAAGVMRMRKRYCTSEHRCLWAVQPCSLTPR